MRGTERDKLNALVFQVNQSYLAIRAIWHGCCVGVFTTRASRKGSLVIRAPSHRPNATDISFEPVHR